MSREQTEKFVEKLVLDITNGTNLELVDVEYVKERDWYLRVFLDKPEGIEMDDCQWVSERLEAKLDELDPIKESYYLEVSSPGLDRVLKKEKDFIRHIGDEVEVHTFAPVDGVKMMVGTLKGLMNDGEIHLDIEGRDVAIPREKASQVRLHLTF
ncbi:ribosome maturation factor RimP [Anaerospora hongkongensis]|jgi:ribosome maturation factor RimP|uniref:Ribosome maturation factor RimP n=1 Tax=Anaerospora hongkongensis TaxID=244830 RepID=A0A4R1Q505_9FIRM|nr:ribosome maturation factor RimP [Anaerospora hongkongensis]TCL40112.1 ribosome maturation factor RimP [Anaerospora hongkongensis]